MNFDEFVNKYNGRATDYDGGCGVQCVDLAKLYMDVVLGIKIGAIGNAEAYWRRYDELSVLKDNFDKIANSPPFIPQKGDIVVWDKRHGKYGHIAIADGVGTTSYFYSYDQNWGGKGQGMTRIKHDYKGGFAGVLRPKSKQTTSDTYLPGQFVEIHVPIGIAQDNGGDKLFVDNLYFDIPDPNKKQFWIHRSLIKNNEIVARVKIVYQEGQRYLVEIGDPFNIQFWIMKNNIIKLLK